jgi:hypothetical protein
MNNLIGRKFIKKMMVLVLLEHQLAIKKMVLLYRMLKIHQKDQAFNKQLYKLGMQKLIIGVSDQILLEEIPSKD